VIPVLAVMFFIFAYWASGKRGLAFMIAPLSAAASAGLLMAVPYIIGAFLWKKATAAGALSSMIGGAILVLALQISGAKPLGLWPGVWGLICCTALYVLVGLGTTPPLTKAETFMGYLEEALSKGHFV
jgi:SSS family solute:Na+ symporter